MKGEKRVGRIDDQWLSVRILSSIVFLLLQVLVSLYTCIADPSSSSSGSSNCTSSSCGAPPTSASANSAPPSWDELAGAARRSRRSAASLRLSSFSNIVIIRLCFACGRRFLGDAKRGPIGPRGLKSCLAGSRVLGVRGGGAGKQAKPSVLLSTMIVEIKWKSEASARIDERGWCQKEFSF